MSWPAGELELEHPQGRANLPGDSALVHLNGVADRRLLLHPEVEIENRQVLERQHQRSEQAQRKSFTRIQR